MKNLVYIVAFFVTSLVCLAFHSPGQDFDTFKKAFVTGYTQLNIPEMAYDYREYFNSIPSADQLNKQLKFFESQAQQLKKFDRAKLDNENQITFDQISYELEFNKERIHLELPWEKTGRVIPVNGLKKLEKCKEWYSFFIKKFTSLNTSPEDIMKFGLSEVKRVNEEIENICAKQGFRNKEEFYTFLKSDTFYYNNKEDILKAFAITDSSIRENLKTFTGAIEIPKVYPMVWADAGPYTPPGIYLNSDNNAYGKDVFQYNFYGERYNKRAIDWIFMHEAIPGHHLQASLRKQNKKDEVQELFSYPGNFEGWACYVEYEGKPLGVYTDDYSYLGKWEWDLIRSARLVLEIGIHYFGWSKEKALEYWKANIYGQDEIAEREITRVTNWPGQALSYKLGAKFIFDLKNKLNIGGSSKISTAEFHRCLLDFGMRPLPVIEKNFEKLLPQKK